MLEIANLGEFSRDLDRWLETCEDLADGAFRGLVVQAFKYVVQGTPEWSGNLAASWKLTVGSPSVGYDETIFKVTGPTGVLLDEPYSRKFRPNHEAIHYAFSIAQSSLPLVRIGAEVFITNNAPYAEQVAANRNSRGRAFLRTVNLPVEMAHAAAEKLSGLGEVSAARAASLSQEKLQ